MTILLFLTIYLVIFVNFFCMWKNKGWSKPDLTRLSNLEIIINYSNLTEIWWSFGVLNQYKGLEICMLYIWVRGKDSLLLERLLKFYQPFFFFFPECEDYSKDYRFFYISICNYKIKFLLFFFFYIFRYCHLSFWKSTFFNVIQISIF